MAYVPAVLRLGQVKPEASTDMRDVLIANNQGFGATTNVQSVSSAQAGAAVLWNPAISGTITVLGAPTSMTLNFQWSGYPTYAGALATPSVSTTPFAYSAAATAASLQTTLQSIPAIGAHVTVSGAAGGPYIYTLDATLYAPDAPLVTPLQSSVVGGTGLVTTQVTGPTYCWVYGLQYTDDTGGSVVQVEALTADPAYSGSGGGSSNKRRKASGVGLPAAKFEYSTGALTAPTAANVTDTFFISASGVVQYFGQMGDVFLEPGTGIRVYVTNGTGAFKFAVNMDWIEFFTNQ